MDGCEMTGGSGCGFDNGSDGYGSGDGCAARTALAVGAEPCGGVVKGPAMVIVMMWMNVINMRFNGSGNLNRQ